MHRFLILTSSFMLTGCATAPRDVVLAGLDLNNPAVIARVSEGLTQQQRAALATFALLHWPESKAYCGRPVFKGASQPSTVGEAIDKTIEFETALARKRLEETQVGSVFERQAQLKRELVDQFDLLTIEREMLASAALSSVERDRRERELARQLADNRQARDRLSAVPAVAAGAAW